MKEFPQNLRMKNILIALLVFGCTHAPKKESTKQNLVLIQGVHLDGTSWNAVKAKLDPEIFNVMDLGRTGRDTEEAASLKNIAELSCAAIPEKSTLVGHSYGGAISNAMVGTCPDKIERIIYISAVVPLNGEKPFDLMNKTDRTNYSKVVTFGKFKIIPKEAMAFFQGTDAAIASPDLYPALYPEWISLTAEPVTYDETKFAAIPKAYIYTERDAVISLTTQFQYTSRTAIKNSDGIPTGHFPMISNPVRLAELITKWSHSF
jgi:pimeloyl-ACP methyl ester carboxylesterase